MRKDMGVYMLCMGLCCFMPLASEQVVLENLSGMDYTMEIDLEAPFSNVIETLTQGMELVEPRTFTGISIVRSQGMFLAKAVKIAPKPRDYYAPLTVQEKADLTYILRTLANSSLIKIKSVESSIKKAGDRLDDLHPFQFLASIFTDEELKVCVRNIYGRSWVWKGFLDGVTTSLTREQGIDNVLSYANDFAARVGVSPDKIVPLLKKGSWEKVVDVLIKDVPRGGDSGRYDM